jgi:hypothetical protein
MPLHFDNKTRATLTSVNMRSENHGEELVPAIDLRFAVDAPRSVLADYHPDLAGHLYVTPAQLVVPGEEPMPCALRFPKLGQPFKWDEESTGHRLAIDYGIDGEDNPDELVCRVHRHVLTLKEGGTVTVEFTCTCNHELDEHTVGRLGLLVKHALWITLSPGQPPDEGDGEEQDGGQGALPLAA